MANIGKNIKSARVEIGLNQVDAAKILDIDQSYLSYLENDKREPTIGLLKKMKKKLNTTYDYLLEGKTADRKPIKTR